MIELSRNYGHQTAIYAGLENSLGRFLIVLDIDLQDPPEIAFQMYKNVKMNILILLEALRSKRRENLLKFLRPSFLQNNFITFKRTNLTSQSSGDFYCMNKLFKDALLINLPSRLYLRGQISKWL